MYAVQKTQLEIITHNFQESGHLYMECDSMHSAIETEKKYIDVYTIIDWISIFRRARRRHPYTVVSLHHDDMFDLQNLAQKIMKNRRQDGDGNIVNWLLVKKDLVKLCMQQVIPAEMHAWYKSLLSASRTKDHLSPAVGDSGDDDDDHV